MTGIDNIDDDDDVSATRKRPILNITTPIRIGGVRRNRCKYRRIVGTGMVTFGLANAPTEINGLKILKKKKTPPIISINQTYLDAEMKKQQSQRDIVLEKDDDCDSLHLEDFKYSETVVLYKQGNAVVEKPCPSIVSDPVIPVSCKLRRTPGEESGRSFDITDVTTSVYPPDTASCNCKEASPFSSPKFCTLQQFENKFKEKAAKLEVTYNSGVTAEKHLHLAYDANSSGDYNNFFLKLVGTLGFLDLVEEPGCSGADSDFP